MLYVIGYLLFLLLELIFSLLLCVFAVLMAVSSLMGSPYVPTKTKEVLQFLKEAKMKKGQLLVELGCGDGRVLRIAAKEYGVKGIGVDINLMLIVWARILNKFQHVKGVTYKVENIYKTDISKADFIYLFLMPEFLKKLRDKFKKESKKGAIFMSHGFKIEGWEKYLYKTIPNKPFPTYYYRLKRK